MALDPEIEKLIYSDAEQVTEPEPNKEPAAAESEESKPAEKKKVNTKALIIVAAAAVAVLLICAVLFSRSNYVQKYEAKYKMAFPAGIPEEFCDEYGKNPTLGGSISFGDIKGKTLFYSDPPENCALLEKGSDFRVRQNYRAIAITKDIADLEALYKDADSFKNSSQSFTVKTVTGEKQKYQVIAAYIINTDAKDDNGYAFPYNCYGNFTKKSYRHYADTIKCRSLYLTGYEIKDTDCCLTVSVPSDIMPSFRFVIVGVKTDKVQKIKTVKENKRIRYPQAYCDKLGIHNIYNFAYKWYPEIIVNNDTGETKQLTAKDFQ